MRNATLSTIRDPSGETVLNTREEILLYCCPDALIRLDKELYITHLVALICNVQMQRSQS